jgi:hypothetical protein
MYFDKIINTAYSFGAAIVVFGAWGKMEHNASGDIALTVGLLVETGIFCIYGLMEWRKQPGQEVPVQERTEGVDESGVNKHGARMSKEPDQHGRPATAGPGMGGADTEELANALKQTNQLLGKIFRAD